MLTTIGSARYFEYSVAVASGGCVIVATTLPRDWRPVLDAFGMPEIQADDGAITMLNEGYRAYSNYARHALVRAAPSVADPEADGLMPADYHGSFQGALWCIGFSIHQAEVIEGAVVANGLAEGRHHVA
jgi:hypothetical protein